MAYNRSDSGQPHFYDADQITETTRRGWTGALSSLLLVLISVPLIYTFVTAPLPLQSQTIVAAVFIVIAALISVYIPRWRLAVALLSILSSLRYIYWRGQNTLSLETWSDASISIFLFAAEVYGVVVLFLGYFQTLELVKRTPAPLPPDERLWPTVDIYIPTYNEDTEILRRTVTGAMAIDYPKKTVYILDDGRRESVRALAEELGCEYITRSDNKGAKAGNINNALRLTKGELIAILDADHVPVKTFLKETVGFFFDKQVAVMQTPHHFYNPDPFERNLNVQGRIAPEGDFFYHVVQVGNDFWNSAFFCGSAGIIRRTALEEVGGFATQTVTEDAHTSLRIHARGYKSVYYPKPLVAGLATERFAFYVSQRIRWARGMVQILRVQNPLLTRGLKLPQRLNYFNAMLHFLFGLPRLAFIIAPLSYLLFSLHPVRGLGLEVLIYALPHIALATIATSMVSRSFRHSFWAEVYESAAATYLAPVTLLALINPRLGKFNVTAKGGFINKATYDWKHAAPILILILMALVSLLVFVPAKWSYLPEERSSIAINAVWTFYNLVILVAAALVAREKPQQRQSPRVTRRFPCTLILPGDEGVSGETLDLSEAGGRIILHRPYAVPEVVTLKIDSEFDESAIVRGRVAWREMGEGGTMTFGMQFEDIDVENHQRLIRLIFSGPESWLERTIPPDRPFRSYWYILSSLWRTREERVTTTRTAPRIPIALPCKIIFDDGRSFVGTTKDISELGVGVFLDSSAWPLPERVRVQLRFREGDTIELMGRTMRPELLPTGQLLVGIYFEDLSYRDQIALAERLYRGQMAQALPVPAEVIARTKQLGQPQPEEPPKPAEPARPELRPKPFVPGRVPVEPGITLPGPPRAPRPMAPPVAPEEAARPAVPPPVAPPAEPPITERLPERAKETVPEPPAMGAFKIIGNKRIGVYYVPGGDYYNQMLVLSSRGGPNWVFFDTEEEALAAGFHRPRTVSQS